MSGDPETEAELPPEECLFCGAALTAEDVAAYSADRARWTSEATPGSAAPEPEGAGEPHPLCRECRIEVERHDEDLASEREDWRRSNDRVVIRFLTLMAAIFVLVLLLRIVQQIAER